MILQLLELTWSLVYGTKYGMPKFLLKYGCFYGGSDRVFSELEVNLDAGIFVDDRMCFRCGKGTETIVHALRGCEVARQIWDRAHFEWDSGYGEDENEGIRFLYEAQNLNGRALQQFSIMVWVVWTGRNKELHGERRKDPMRSVFFALHYIDQFNDAQGRDNSVHMKPAVREFLQGKL